MIQLVDWAQRRPNTAYLYAVLGNLALAIGQILVKTLTVYLNPFQIMYLRSFLVALINFYFLRRMDKYPYISSPQYFRKVVYRSIVNHFSFIAMFYCLMYLPVSTVTTLFNMGPIFIFFIEMLHHKHKIDPTSFLLTLLSFIGVVLMVQPSFLFGENQTSKIDNYAFYVFLMILSAFANALNSHLVHGLAKKVDPFINIHYSHLVTLVFGGVINTFTQKTMDPSRFNLTFMILALGMALAGFASITLIFLSNQLKKPSLMMPFGYFGVATGLIADVYLFDTKFSLMTTLGIFLTSIGLLSGFILKKEKPELKMKGEFQSREARELEVPRENEGILMEINEREQKAAQK